MITTFSRLLVVSIILLLLVSACKQSQPATQTQAAEAATYEAEIQNIRHQDVQVKVGTTGYVD